MALQPSSMRSMSTTNAPKLHGEMNLASFVVFTLRRASVQMGITDFAKFKFWHQDTWGELLTDGLQVGRVKPGLKNVEIWCDNCL